MTKISCREGGGLSRRVFSGAAHRSQEIATQKIRRLTAWLFWYAPFRHSCFANVLTRRAAAFMVRAAQA
jgi:hypothetical protein